MKYPEHINEFWRMRDIDSSLTNVDLALYSYLCNKLNATFWATDRITQRREIICGLLGINPRQLEESRNRLKQKGFIDFISQTQTNKAGKKQGVKGSATVYIVLNEISVSVPNSVPHGTPSGREQEHETGTKRALSDTDKEIEIETILKKYTCEADQFDSVEEYLTTHYSLFMDQQKMKYGLDKLNLMLKAFSDKEVQTVWKSRQDMKGHFSNFCNAYARGDYKPKTKSTNEKPSTQQPVVYTKPKEYEPKHKSRVGEVATPGD